MINRAAFALVLTMFFSKEFSDDTFNRIAYNWKIEKAQQQDPRGALTIPGMNPKVEAVIRRRKPGQVAHVDRVRRYGEAAFHGS